MQRHAKECKSFTRVDLETSCKMRLSSLPWLSIQPRTSPPKLQSQTGELEPTSKISCPQTSTHLLNCYLIDFTDPVCHIFGRVGQQRSKSVPIQETYETNAWAADAQDSGPSDFGHGTGSVVLAAVTSESPVQSRILRWLQLASIGFNCLGCSQFGSPVQSRILRWLQPFLHHEGKYVRWQSSVGDPIQHRGLLERMVQRVF